MRSGISPILSYIRDCKCLRLFYSRDGESTRLEIVKFIFNKKEEDLFPIEIYDRDNSIESLHFLEEEECKNIGIEVSYFGDLEYIDILINYGDEFDIYFRTSLIIGEDDIEYSEIEKLCIRGGVLFSLERDHFGRRYYKVVTK